MANRPLPRRREQRSKSFDANLTLSVDWTHEVSEYVKKLPEIPEVTYLRNQIWSKFVSDETDPPLTRRTRAINKWLATERNNEATNDRLFSTCSEFKILPHVDWSLFVDKVREIILGIIGDVVPEEALIGSFSGGASTSRNRTESYPASKYLGQADITSACQDWFDLAIELMPGWETFSEQRSLNVVKGNILFTVPKTTTIDRCACKEPDINMFLQKGAGNIIRDGLRRVGINLNDQSRNQDLAREGSLTGSLATLDLSSASDSVSSALVELVMPPLWFSLLNGLRSPITIIDGDEHVNEMFSSMGNGFTFELESLLFYALARATSYFEGVSGVISVYGDDIIVPSRLADTLVWVLSYFGFETNVSKSFSEGPFRESCGGHYYNGYDITPFYVKEPIKRLTDLIHLGNQIRRWSGRNPIGVLSPLLEPLWQKIRDAVPSQFWGGRDTGSIYQLVTPDLPRKRLTPFNKEKILEDGAYIHWLNATWKRKAAFDPEIRMPAVTSPRAWVRDDFPDEGVVTSRLSDTGKRCRSRPAIPLDRGYCSMPLSRHFLTEM